MSTEPTHEQRISTTEQAVVQIRADLRSVGRSLDEIKTALNSSRPNVWVIVPIALTFILMIVGSVAAFGGVREAAAYERGRVDRMEQDFRRIEQRQWERQR